MGRAPCCDKANVKKGPWSPEEDAKLKAYIEQHGTGGNWIALPQKIGLKRCGKSCRLRWLNYLRPNIKHGGFSEEEDNIICSLYISIGSRWSIIAAQLPGRTDNDIKNYWNTKLKKKLLGKQRKDQRARRPARYLKEEMKRKREDLLTAHEAIINTYPPYYQVSPLPPANEEGHLGAETLFHSVNYEQFGNNADYNQYNFQYPSHISCADQDQLLIENPIAMHAPSLSSMNVTTTNGDSSASSSSTTTCCYPLNWVGANSLQGFDNWQHFGGFDSFASGVDMINTSPESASWKDISSLVYPSTASPNLELYQQIIMPNCRGHNNCILLQ